MKKYPSMKFRYVWYCKKCWMTGVIASRTSDKVHDTCYNIHNQLAIPRCRTKKSNIVVVST